MLKSRSGRAIRSCMALALSVALASVTMPSSAQGDPSSTALRGEILWDELGIPHIYGPDLPSVIRGFGYAQMQNHAESLLANIAQARGRAAEYFGAGPDGSYVASDTQVRTFGIPDRAREWLIKGGPEQRQYLNAAVAGMNDYAQRHGDTIDPAFRQVLPIVAEDLLATIQQTVLFTFQLGQSAVPQLLTEWLGSAAAGQQQSPAPLLRTAKSIRNGSNGWALAPQKSTSGNAVLLGNPHLPWGNNQPIAGLGIYQWMEAHLVVGDPSHPTLNASGVAFLGQPSLVIGYTDDVGWTHTVNTIKNADLYELTLTGPNTYLFDGRPRPFSKRADSLRIRQADGSYVTQKFSIVSSVHGPVIAQRDDKALALRVAGLDASAPVTQYVNMLRSRNLKEFNEANSALQMPFFNVVYADRNGQIMYLFGGRQPVRSGGSFNDWAGILPGDAPSALWTTTLAWRDLPKTIDPPGGFVQNGNDAPWTSTFPQVLRVEDYPAWIAPQFTELRPQQNARFLLSQPSFTTKQVLVGKMSTRMELAARVLPDLLQAANKSGNATASQAAAVLSRWDLDADARSRGAVLFERWWNLYSNAPGIAMDQSMSLYYPHPAFRIGWDPADPLRTPQGLAETGVAVQTLIAAAQQVLAAYGRLDVAWGDVHRTVLATRDPAFQKIIPISDDAASGPDDVFGAVRVVNPFPAPDGLHAWHYGGEGYVQLVEFKPSGVEAQALMTYGNASRPGSIHITDQLGLFARKQLRKVLRDRAEIEKHAISRDDY